MNNQAQPVPTKEQLTQAITNLILQRSQMKDAVENFDKQIPVLQGQLQLLQLQEAEKAEIAAKAAEEAAATQD